MPTNEVVWSVSPASTQVQVYPWLLPEGLRETVDDGFQTYTTIKKDLPIRLVEKATIKFTDDFNGDIYGSNITIDVSADDDLICKIGREAHIRNYQGYC